jgi:CheY-like chemotaxis protein
MQKRRRIMVIDDDAMLLQVTRELLEHDGYDVLTLQNAFGATSAIRATRPDLVLLDVNMPALSGENLAHLILSNTHTRAVPIVFYSSNDEDSLSAGVRKHGVRGYICKGDISMLRRKVREYADVPAGRDSPAP